jgi:hypothetical protein
MASKLSANEGRSRQNHLHLDSGIHSRSARPNCDFTSARP